MPDAHRRPVDGEQWASAIRAAVRRERAARGWSLREAAERSGGQFKPGTLGAYERGDRQISLSLLHQLAELYEVPVERFIPRSDGAGDTNGARIARALDRLPDRHRTLLCALAEELQRSHLDP